MQLIVIYTKVHCAYCERAKMRIRSEGWEYEERLLKTPEEFQALKARTGLMTVPQVFVADELIGGSDDLENKIDYVRELMK